MRTNIAIVILASIFISAASYSKPKFSPFKKHTTMSEKKSIQKEKIFSQSPEKVWKALTDSTILAQWIYPNNFEPKVGHKFTFEVPGIEVHCQVLECDPPKHLSYSWEGGPVVGTTVTYRLEPEGKGTRLIFEHSGFDATIPNAQTYIGGAEYGWNMMLGKLENILEGK
jgi:uncharacterized protein YndB with AHSA1/START domain